MHVVVVLLVSKAVVLEVVVVVFELSHHPSTNHQPQTNR